MNKFADRLREIQRSRSMTQAELAKLIEVAPGTLSAYLRDGDGRKYPALDTLERIAGKLEVSIGWLCGEDVQIPQVRTYADLFRILVAAIDAAETEQSVPSDTDCLEIREYCAPRICLYGYDREVSIVFKDPTALDFFTGYSKLRDLLCDGTIDREIYDAWLEKKLRDYASVRL